MNLNQKLASLDRPDPGTNRVNILSRLGAPSKNVWEGTFNLGLIFHSKRSFDAQVTKAVQWCFSPLKQLSKNPIPLSSTLRKHHYCFYFFQTWLLQCTLFRQANTQRLQLIQNTTTGLLTRTKRSDHVTPVLAALHCLQLRFTIDFFFLIFILQLVFKSLEWSGSCLHPWTC